MNLTLYFKISFHLRKPINFLAERTFGIKVVSVFI
ncbi:hypothetical protein LSS_21025 [Leptospira santarosai serovar Shermani str. LT 821]|uniref:Uncharacterized protein n=1 Tax=Leptospira santarosai serovar Shermani str. LT 821 TaxID=758847 RepID=A0A097ESB4_9LEPT|nr:hypothetical protein LSS_21025 [Leptospira santarosai serovar Shermani str. LT 821]